ncbi:aminotransferase [Micromonospora echinospora]|uniref:Aminotransferase n=1 Tax=Micromonospora echinospora TaxID=1877 RepID=A0A1C4YSG2_MICEC|nr:aminotransferase [Micromonospora echinospora]OZV77383.1 aminotransferase [Micromonospora echinospora]SCF23732.1 Aspartate/methionine/tyrosine aminotransferase [Micromonospora echinospora]
MRLNRRVIDQTDSPIGAAYALADRRDPGLPLLDCAQAALQHPPASSVRDHVVAVAADAHGADYVELQGLPRLRTAFAKDLCGDYQGHVHHDQILVTAGCNQAFCLAISALAAAGDEVIIALPYYFNHDMWLRIEGLVPRYLEPGPDLLPTTAAAEKLIGPRTRAIVLVTPGNPTGLTVPADTIADFYRLAQRHGIALVLDETYRSYRGSVAPAHNLFADRRWPATLVSLHSFSKDLAIPGYRVGAVVAAPALVREAMKVLDCVAICAPRIGQEAAWAGLTRAGDWRRARTRELVDKHALFTAVMADSPGGFELLASGGFFGWIRHPFTDRATDDVVRDLAVKQGVLVIPGTAFLPDDRQTMRVSFANLANDEFPGLAARLAAAGRSGRSDVNR